MTSPALAARSQLADLFEEVGPDAPTLCGDWKTRDLAAHLVLRERRPDAAGGIVIKALAGHTRAVQDKLARKPWAELVGTVRRRSPLLIGPLDQILNTTEYFVHTEDVRRAADPWKPLPADPALEAALWRTLKARGRLAFRKSPVGVILQLPDGTQHRVNDAEPAVTLVGAATELTLYVFGRTDHALVEIHGDSSAMQSFADIDLSV